MNGHDDRPPRRSRRRSVRPAGTVGGDDRVLRSSFPAPRAPGAPGAPGAKDEQDEQDVLDELGAPGAQEAGPAAAAPPPAPPDAAAPPAATTPPRAPDDLDVGWGAAVDDSNDDRLTRDKPPHW